MRGKRERAVLRISHGRITPAHAGKTSMTCPGTGGKPDHPRACGENCLTLFAVVGSVGSPPRMRGKQDDDAEDDGLHRITPAHAGKTARRERQDAKRADHPRACGENLVQQLHIRAHIGSPPRMRGKPEHETTILPGFRITPAHAGKTLRKWRISVVDPSPQPQSSLTSRKADASSGSQRAPCAAPV